MNELDNYRQKIDAIDQELTRLFEERLETVLKVGDYKKENQLPILDAIREQELIDKNVARLKNTDFQDDLTQFYKSMMTITKNTQKRLFKNEK